MKFTIKSKFDGSVLLEVEADSFVKAVEEAVRQRAYLAGAYLTDANLTGAYLAGANLAEAYLTDANLAEAYLTDANLTGAYLVGANLARANLAGANLADANLAYANLAEANLAGAYLTDANLTGAYLAGASLAGAKNLVKIMGVEPGNFYWKRFEKGLQNNDYQFYVGLNTLREGEVFASDDREDYSFPGFHFASRSWCAVNYPDRPLEAHIRIPMDAQINEPWTTDGKASASAIEILQVFDVKTGEDVTNQYRPVKKSTKKR